MDESKELEWTEEQINRPGEYHPIGKLFGGEVQLWVVSADPEDLTRAGAAASV